MEDCVKELDLQGRQAKVTGGRCGWGDWRTHWPCKGEVWEGHHLTGPVLGRNQNNQEQWRSVVGHLSEPFPERFRLGESDAFIIWCLDEERLVIRGRDRQKVYWKDRMAWFFTRALWRGG